MCNTAIGTHINCCTQRVLCMHKCTKANIIILKGYKMPWNRQKHGNWEFPPELVSKSRAAKTAE